MITKKAEIKGFKEKAVKSKASLEKKTDNKILVSRTNMIGICDNIISLSDGLLAILEIIEKS